MKKHNTIKTYKKKRWEREHPKIGSKKSNNPQVSITVTVANKGLYGFPTKNGIILVVIVTAWRITPLSKWLITLVSKSPKGGNSPYK